MGARWYEARIGRWVSADIIVPDPTNPQNLNRYAYVLGNPLRYTDPTGHIENDPDELRRAQEILDQLRDDYDVLIRKTWGWIYPGTLWAPGLWELAELETALVAVSDFGAATGIKRFRQHLGGLEFDRREMGNSAGETPLWGRRIWLSKDGFSEWTVVHEMGHAWDRASGWRLSSEMQHEVGAGFAHPWRHSRDPGNSAYWYDPGRGPPPCGVDANFDRREDFAESMAAYVYPAVARNKAIARGRPYEDAARGYRYADFYATPRGQFIWALVLAPL